MDTFPNDHLQHGCHLPPAPGLLCQMPFDVDMAAERFTPHEDPLLLRQVFEYYHETLGRTPRALEYLRKRGLADPDVIDTFQIGFSNRTLGFRIPDAKTIEGGSIRGQLQRAGVLRPSGHELLRGSLVFPVFDENKNVVDAYGRKITYPLRSGTAYHVTMADEPQGLCNTDALERSQEIILCKSPVEAATFWCARFRNVVATLGMRAFTDANLEAFARNRTSRVYVAFDNSSAGDRAARLVAQALSLIGTECRRIVFPVGMDANAFARVNTSPTSAFSELIRTARPFGQSYDALREDPACSLR